jgi:hypothetical protein
VIRVGAAETRRGRGTIALLGRTDGRLCSAGTGPDHYGAPMLKAAGFTSLRRSSGGARELQTAVANLLRIPGADVADARLLLRKGRERNAAGLDTQAFVGVIRAVAVSENGWPLDGRNCPAAESCRCPGHQASNAASVT